MSGALNLPADLNLVVARHAEATHQNRSLVVGLAPEAPLTDWGKEQAAILGGWLLENDLPWCKDPATGRLLDHPHAVYASRTERAINTARIALRAMGLANMPIIEAPEINEQHHGLAEGMRRDEIWTEQRKQELEHLNRIDPAAALQYALPGGESPYDAGLRMLRWAEPLGGMVLAFAHRNATLSMAALINNWPQNQTFDAFFPNASVMFFKRRNGVWQRGYTVRIPFDVNPYAQLKTAAV